MKVLTAQNSQNCSNWRGKKLCGGIVTIRLIFMEHQFSLDIQEIRLYYLLDIKRSFLKSSDSFVVHEEGLFDSKQ